MRRTLMWLWGALAGANFGLAIAYALTSNPGGAWDSVVKGVLCGVASMYCYELMQWEKEVQDEIR